MFSPRLLFPPLPSTLQVDNIYWTQEVAEAIEKGKLEDYYQACGLELGSTVGFLCLFSPCVVTMTLIV